VPFTLIAIGLFGIYEAYSGEKAHEHTAIDAATAPVIDTGGLGMSLAMQSAGTVASSGAAVPMPSLPASPVPAAASLSVPQPGESEAQRSKRAGFTTYMTGIVHGLQPDALYVVIPALALPTKLAAVAFIGMFVIGTVVSMGGYTLMIGTTSRALLREQPWMQAHLSTVACGFAVLCGVLMLLAGQGVPVPIFS